MYPYGNIKYNKASRWGLGFLRLLFKTFLKKYTHTHSQTKNYSDTRYDF